MIPVDENLEPQPLSRLSYKIMGLNLIALIMLGTGILYLDKYKRDLTAAETEIMATETRLYGSLLADNAITGTAFIKPKAENLLANFVLQKSQRLRLFDSGGQLLIDVQGSHEKIPVKGLPGWLGGLVDESFAYLVDLLSPSYKLPLYPEIVSKKSFDYPDVKDAYHGKVSFSAWRDTSNNLVFSSAAPIFKNGELAGVLSVTRTGIQVAKTFAAMRLDILKLFLGALVITLVFSLYLSAVIGHPLRQLAGAAEKVRQGSGSENAIPDLSVRNDEIGELSIALREMTFALQERMETIEKFAADVAHELKNPLTSISSAIETMHRVTSADDKNQLLAIIRHDLIRMDRLISDISLSSRLDVELARDVFKKISLNDVLRSVIQSLEYLVQDKEIIFVTTGFENNYAVLGHSLRLEQVFQNLLSNAVSFSPLNSIIEVELRSSEKNTVEVKITDQGSGIPKNATSRIFERFYTERPEGEGFGNHSGLGLAIARQIVEAHDGKIKAENIYNANGDISGAVFTVKLETA